jgi:hypothetical protein
MVIMSSDHVVGRRPAELREMCARAPKLTCDEQLRRRPADALGMSLDPYRSRPMARHTPFAPSCRLERTAVLIGAATAAVGLAILRLSVGGGLLAWWALVLVEGALVAAALGLGALISLLTRRGVG